MNSVEKDGDRNDTQLLLARFLTFFEEMIPSMVVHGLYGRASHFLRHRRPNEHPNEIFEYLEVYLHSFESF